jgi:hypothetical protein
MQKYTNGMHAGIILKGLTVAEGNIMPIRKNKPSIRAKPIAPIPTLIHARLRNPVSVDVSISVMTPNEKS